MSDAAMSLEFNDVVKQGYVRFRSRKLQVLRRRWVVFRRASSSGPRRLEKYADERAAASASRDHKVVLLEGVVEVVPATKHPHPRGGAVAAVCLVWPDSSKIQLHCQSELEANDWLKALLAHLGPKKDPHLPDLLHTACQQQQQPSERLPVFLLPSTGTGGPKGGVCGECFLQVTPDNIHLWDVDNPSLRLLTWPLKALNRYGSDASKFSFETNRNCETGEGLFTLRTSHGALIYQRVHSASLAIARQYRCLDPPPPSPPGDPGLRPSTSSFHIPPPPLRALSQRSQSYGGQDGSGQHLPEYRAQSLVSCQAAAAQEGCDQSTGSVAVHAQEGCDQSAA